MKEEIDLIAVDLFHPDAEFVSALDEYIIRSGVSKAAARKSQAVSEPALDLICRKAEQLGTGRDQVIQQAILFRAAVVTFSDREYQLMRARAELQLLEAQVKEARRRVNELLGADHGLVDALVNIERAVERLAA